MLMSNSFMLLIAVISLLCRYRPLRAAALDFIFFLHHKVFDYVDLLL